MSYIIREIANELEREMVYQLRQEVFVKEQGIPAYLDKDGRDEQSRHVIVLNAQEEIMAGGRLSPHPKENIGILSRIAVSKVHRGKGLGKKVIKVLESLASEDAYQAVQLKPHLHLESFYQSQGYKTLSKDENPAGKYPLLLMEKVF
ncbi:MAG: GNAT family N-acetyltransferase [Bacteroidia bacterium]|nr:GNAT family N-acetyltransferase [Bacteroidia bacterium]